MHYEMLKHTGEYPIVGVNTFRNPHGDAGAKPATGRSGSAAIQVRALRGQNNTDIEVTTGDFDNATQAGVLDKVQVKIFEPNGNPVVTDNYRKGTLSGGVGTFAYDWPMRGAGVQVQANVSGIDPKRTDVVTVPTIVKLRPDLAIQSIQLPALGCQRLSRT